MISLLDNLVTFPGGRGMVDCSIDVQLPQLADDHCGELIVLADSASSRLVDHDQGIAGFSTLLLRCLQNSRSLIHECTWCAVVVRHHDRVVRVLLRKKVV